MSKIKKLVGGAAIGCVVCMGAVTAPMAITAPADAGVVDTTIAALLDEGVIRLADPDECQTVTAASCPDWLAANDAGATHDTVLVVTPGTDDGTLYPRIKGMRAGRQTVVISYPESLGPFITGRSDAALPLFAPTYDASRDIAIANNVAVMRAFQTLPASPHVVYSGYSQGADALGDAAEQAVAEGAIDPATSHIFLISDPRSPWGLKAWAASNVFTSTFFEVFGAESNGARDPGATGDELPVTSVIVVGDPVANFQWLWYRPLSSAVVDLAGFITIHSGAGEQNYGNLIDYSQPPRILTSTAGNTTYVIYQPNHHPLTMLAMVIYDAVGIPYTDGDLTRWDRANNAFYPLQQPDVGNAAVGVSVPGAAITQPQPVTTDTVAASSAARLTTAPATESASPTTETAQPLSVARPGTAQTSEADTEPETPAPKPPTQPADSGEAAGGTTGTEATGEPPETEDTPPGQTTPEPAGSSDTPSAEAAAPNTSPETAQADPNPAGGPG